MRSSADLRDFRVSMSDPSPTPPVAVANDRPASERSALTNNEGRGHVQNGHGSEGGTQDVQAVSSADNQAGATKEAPRVSPGDSWTARERKAFRIGGLAALEKGSAYLADLGHKKAPRDLETLRIRIAACSVDFEPPTEWPQRGGT